MRTFPHPAPQIMDSLRMLPRESKPVQEQVEHSAPAADVSGPRAYPCAGTGDSATCANSGYRRVRSASTPDHFPACRSTVVPLELASQAGVLLPDRQMPTPPAPLPQSLAPPDETVLGRLALDRPTTPLSLRPVMGKTKQVKGPRPAGSPRPLILAVPTPGPLNSATLCSSLRRIPGSSSRPSFRPKAP